MDIHNELYALRTPANTGTAVGTGESNVVGQDRSR